LPLSVHHAEERLLFATTEQLHTAKLVAALVRIMMEWLTGAKNSFLALKKNNFIGYNV